MNHVAKARVAETHVRATKAYLCVMSSGAAQA